LLPYKGNIIHPGRMWCHCRVVYLPMSYMYTARFQGPVTPLIEQIRRDIYPGMDYATIDWDNQRFNCCSKDQYFQRPWIQRMVWNVMNTFEWASFVPGRDRLQKAALEETIDHIMQEDRNTDFICIGPVNKVLNMLACWFHDPDSDHFKNHLRRVPDYLWLAEDGMKMQGYNGSQLWDTSFFAQAIMANPEFAKLKTEFLQKTYGFFDIAQVLVEVPRMDKYYRHISKGAWAFSTRDHGWPITDCTSEGLKAVLRSHALDIVPHEKRITDERIFDCVNVLLSLQNKDGGWATYELNRAPTWLEIMNPSEVFGDIMVDFSYVECSSSTITGLIAFQSQYPGHRSAEIAEAIRRGIMFIISIQREDGSWYGSWGVCFTYGTWFGVEALVAAGETVESSSPLRRACEFLLSKQRADGAWGESYLSCQDKVYSEADEGQVVNTGWALLSLCRAQWPDRSPLRRAADFLVRMQDENGDWPQQLISGVFNRNCMITYGKYRATFPMWALNEYSLYES